MLVQTWPSICLSKQQLLSLRPSKTSVRGNGITKLTMNHAKCHLNFFLMRIIFNWEGLCRMKIFLGKFIILVLLNILNVLRLLWWSKSCKHLVFNISWCKLMLRFILILCMTLAHHILLVFLDDIIFMFYLWQLLWIENWVLSLRIFWLFQDLSYFLVVINYFFQLFVQTSCESFL